MSDRESLDYMKASIVHRVKGPTILLGSGTYFDYESPETSEITIEDVAYSLAFICRFAGQCVEQQTGQRVYYSVAEHCVRMSRQAPAHLAYDALMHELGEAATGVDMTSPLKFICPDYKAIEKRCDAALMTRFGVKMSDPDAIKLLDLRMLATERRDLMAQTGKLWSCLDGIEPFEERIVPWRMMPSTAATVFLTKFLRLKPEGVRLT